MMGASPRSIGSGRSIANFSPSTIQSFICTVYGWLFLLQSGLSRHHCSTHAHLHSISSTHAPYNGLHYELAADISQFDDDTHIQLLGNLH